MSYLCDICGTQFAEPLVVQKHERLGDWSTVARQELCPICNTPYISRAVDCQCGGLRLENERMCRACRGSLLKRVSAFFDELTAEEEEQFDDWMDGDSIIHRKAWK